MKKSLPLYVVVLLVGLALLPSIYFLGLEQGKKTQSQPAPAAVLTDQSAVDPSVVGKFTHFRVGNRNVKSILADGDVVWVGTSGGVIRYDMGQDEYKLFDVSNNSLLSNGVFHLSEWGGQLLVGTYGGGLSLYNKQNQQWRNFNIPQGLADQFVYDTQRLQNGDLWIATWSGANRVRGGKLADAEAWEIFNKANTQGGLPNDWIYGVEVDSQGAVWFATEAGVARYAQGQWRNWRHEDGIGAKYERVKDAIKFTRDPSTASRHHAQQKQDQGFSRVTVAYNPNYIVALEIDREDTLWAGTWGAGLARFDGTKWRNYTTADGLPSNHIFTMFLDKAGRLWIGTSEGLVLYQVATDDFRVYTKKHGLYADNVFSLAETHDGTLWVGSFGGVARLRLAEHRP